MLTVIIPTHNSERALVPTLAMLVPGALTGTVREVIVADDGSTDATADVVDIAGCDIVVSQAPLATRLKSAAATARGTWLLFLRPGVVLDAAWLEEVARVVENAVLRGTVDTHAAVFRRAPPDAAEPLVRQVARRDRRRAARPASRPGPADQPPMLRPGRRPPRRGGRSGARPAAPARAAAHRDAAHRRDRLAGARCELAP